jgi:hypothetical protein
LSQGAFLVPFVKSFATFCSVLLKLYDGGWKIKVCAFENITATWELAVVALQQSPKIWKVLKNQFQHTSGMW